MNNSKLAIESLFDEEVEVDTQPILRKKEDELVKIIDAIKGISESNEWKVLKELIFDDLVTTLEKRLRMEATKPELDDPEIYRLNGQLAWARKYADFNKLIEAYRTELSNVRKKLNA